MSFLDDVRARAAAAPARVVFAEGGDPRVVAAAREVRDLGIAHPVLVVDGARADAHADALASGLECRDPATDPATAAIAASLHARRRGRGVGEEMALAQAREPLYFADGLVAMGEADGSVAGAIHTTGAVLRAAIHSVGAAEGIGVVSSAFYMVCPPFRGGPEVLTFTDCAVVRYPSPEELAGIALAAAADRRRIVGDEPVLAFLSFSTRGSAAGPTVERVRAAVTLVRDRAPGLEVDGELQGDAALVAAVARSKAPDSRVAGRANVLVFPGLDSGNIAYKLVQWIGGAQAIGPIVQGLQRPCNDLSRGASVEDIINVAAITSLQAHGGPDLRTQQSRKESTT